MQKIENLFRLRRAGGVFDSGINVFRVFAEDRHVHFFWMFDGRGDAFEVLNWPEANEKIQQLPQRNVERANAATHGRRQRSFDSDQILAERFHSIVRQPFIELVLRRLTGENFEPRDFLPAAIGLFDCRIEHAHTRRPDIRSCPVSANERNDRLIRHIQPVGSGNFFARGRSNIFVSHKAETVAAGVSPAIT